VEQIRDLALDLRTYIPEPMPRKVIKQTVMTTIYGVTKFGARSQIKRQLKALGIPNDKVMGFATYLADKTLGSLTEAFESSMYVLLENS
jgi:DNA-directed RNA polymerase